MASGRSCFYGTGKDVQESPNNYTRDETNMHFGHVESNWAFCGVKHPSLKIETALKEFTTTRNRMNTNMGEKEKVKNKLKEFGLFKGKDFVKMHVLVDDANT